MNKDIFRFKTANTAKLKAYGFCESDGGYTYKTDILNGQFELRVNVSGSGEVTTLLSDNSLNEEYVLHLVEGSTGEFVGKVRAEYEGVLTDICNKCFEKEVFKSEQTKQVIEYIRAKYGDELEFLWEKFDNNAIWRRKDNQKWYGLLVVLPKSKLGLNGDELIEIMDLRADPIELENLIDNERYFKAYHMNKKHWLTVCLDGSLPTKTLFELIDKSYALALKK